MPLRYRKPTFVADKDSAVEFGNTVHKIMEHIDYKCCDSIEGISSEMNRIAQAGFIKADHIPLVDPNMILSFFETELGKKFMVAPELLREFKFSVLVGGEAYLCAGDDKVLLQGVVDCALIEDDGVTVVDFKTDRVTDESLDSVTDAYRYQVKAYTDALTKIYDKPIKGAYLYFFRMKRLVSIL